MTRAIKGKNMPVVYFMFCIFARRSSRGDKHYSTNTTTLRENLLKF